MPRHDESGFAIPMVVLLVALITVMLASGFARVRADRLVAESQEVAAEALAIARAGLGSFMDAQTARPSDGVVDTMYVTGGYAIVIGNVVQNPADTLASQLWVLRSTGYVIDPATGSVPRATRTVAQFAQWQSASIRVRAAWASADGIQRPGGPPQALAVTIDGSNACGSASGTSGLRVDQLTGPPNKTFTSTPAYIIESGIEDSAYIDWQSVLDGGLAPDYGSPTIYPSQSPSGSITVVEGDYTTGTGFLSGIYGSGLLVVTGRLRIRSWIIWSGVVLVGGDIDFEGGAIIGSYISGMLVSGLNAQVGSLGAAKSDLTTTHRVTVAYSQCAVESALDGLIGFAPIDNAWVDNWATY